SYKTTTPVLAFWAFCNEGDLPNTTANTYEFRVAAGSDAQTPSFVLTFKEPLLQPCECKHAYVEFNNPGRSDSYPFHFSQPLKAGNLHPHPAQFPRQRRADLRDAMTGRIAASQRPERSKQMKRSDLSAAGRLTRPAALLVLAAAFVALAAPILRAQMRDDIVVSVDPDSFIFLRFDSDPAPIRLTRGAVQLSTDDALCVPSPSHPCRYTVNLVRLYISSFQLGDFTATDPFIVIEGPIQTTNIGGGLSIPAGTPVTTSAVISGPHITTGFRTTHNT